MKPATGGNNSVEFIPDGNKQPHCAFLRQEIGDHPIRLAGLQ